MGKKGLALKTPPGPDGLPLLGTLPDLVRKEIMPFYHRLWRKYGDLVRIPLGPIFQYLVTRPDHIQHVLWHNWRNYCKGSGWRNLRRVVGDGLLTSEGKLWQHQRRLAQPSFQPQACRELAGVIRDVVEGVLARWRGLAERQEAIDVM